MLTVYEPATDNELLIWACESRNSDNIMVITADRSCSDINDMFNDVAWKSAKYFKCDDYDVAVDYVFKKLKYIFKDKIFKGNHYKFKSNYNIEDIRRIEIDAKDLDYEDYYDLATFWDIDEKYLCDLIILDGKMGLRYSSEKDNGDIENLYFEEVKLNLGSDTTLMLNMKERLEKFIYDNLEYDISFNNNDSKDIKI